MHQVGKQEYIRKLLQILKFQPGRIFSGGKEEMSRISMDTVTLIFHIVQYVTVRSRNSLFLQTRFALTTPKMSPLRCDAMYSDTN